MKTDVKGFLSSGLLEQYMMGICAEDQIEEVEYYIDNFPEVKAEYDRLQHEVDNIADKFSDSTPDGLKDAIISCLEDDTNYEVKTNYVKRRSPRFQFMPWAAACIAFIASIALFNQKIDLQRTNMEMHAELNMVQNQLEENQKYRSYLEEKLFISGHNKTERLFLTGNELSPKFNSTVFWNDVARKAVVYVNNLGKIDKSSCYQIWADVDGEMINAGVLPRKKGAIEIKHLENATSINITIEPKGGSDHPNVEKLISSMELLKI